MVRSLSVSRRSGQFLTENSDLSTHRSLDQVHDRKQKGASDRYFVIRPPHSENSHVLTVIASQLHR